MDDLIKRSDAINELEDMQGYRDEDGYVMIFKSDAIDRINCISTINRPKGEWINQHENGHGFWVGTCNQCGKENRVNNYCPNCGAKMEGVDNE